MPPALDPAVAARITAAAAALEQELIGLTRALIACRTDSQSEGNPHFAAEALRCQDLVAASLADAGLEVQRWLEPPRYPVVAARLPGAGNGRSLALNGHIDVVPVGETDYGTRNTIQRLPRVDAVIDAEPTDLKLMPVEGGLVHMRMEVEGLESHAGNRYLSVHAGGHGTAGGVNAIEKAIRLVTALQDLERQWATERRHPLLPPGFNTILPGIIVGGPGGGADGRLNLVSNPGTTPNYCAVEFNIWYLPGETLAGIRAEIEAIVLAHCALDPWLRDHPPRFTWSLRNVFFPPAETLPDHAFIQTMAAALAETGRPATVEAFTAASELAWYAEQGMSGTIFGPGRIAQAHSPNEYVEVAQLLDACRVMALTAAAWCGVA